MDFTIASTNSKLDDFVTAMPPQYISWKKNTTIKGTTNLYMTLKGQYIAATNSMPNLVFDMQIRDGYVAYDKAPFPASNIFLNLRTKMPSLNKDSLQVTIDSVYFNVDKDYFSAIINTRGITKPFINANISASMDLEKLDNAVGLQNIDLKGKCKLHFTANGLYQSGPNPNSIRHENMLLSIPAFNLTSTISNGYFKYGSLPQAVSNISFDIKSSCADNDYRHTGFSINNLSAIALNNFIKGHAAANSIKEMLLDANLQSAINLAEIKNIYPLQGLDLAGLLKFYIIVKGKYDGVAKKYPITTADFVLTNGSIKTTYYPNPVSNINVVAKASNAGGNLKSQEFAIQPATLQFEGKPFEVQATFKNFEDVNYDIKATGELDVAKIYKVFSLKGLDVTGFIKADCRFKGKQSDAMNKRYNRLHNEGILELRDIATTTAYLPNPFIIKEGLFKFKQDKMWFNDFKALYGQSDMTMNGYLQNIVAYALTPDAVLKGEFNLQSGYFNVDEWMVFAPEQTANSSTDSIKKTAAAPAETGVVVIPTNLDLTMTANAKKVAFNGIKLDNGKGQLNINKGTLAIKKTGFTIIGSETLVDANYTSNSINKATFDFHITTADFDIKKAYDSIKLFRDMATAAGKAKGIISLDYSIKGKLDGNMRPIYPSLEGVGILSVKNVQVKGFKLLDAVSKKTGKDSIANPDISKVDIKSTVKNNLIKLEKFKIKMAGFRLRMQGETSLDGKLNMKFRLGLPPLGIIGIPMIVKGTQEHPIIKMGKGGTDELKETEHQEGEN